MEKAKAFPLLTIRLNEVNSFIIDIQHTISHHPSHSIPLMFLFHQCETGFAYWVYFTVKTFDI